MPLKITTWNLKHADRLVANNPNSATLNRRQRVRATIEEIDPDILCLQEGPKGEQAIDAFCTQVLQDDWRPALLRQPAEALGAQDAAYKTKGTQWIWFLVRAELQARCRLQAPEIWQALTNGQTWLVNYWGQVAVERHSHYRHPQVLLYDLDNDQRLELIGVHLKSKINQQTIERDAQGNLTGAYLNEALQARVKLATEARNVRQYLEAKANQLARPALLVMGDCNDGPGHDLFEQQYLFFDLLSNLQGDVIVAEQFLQHVLTTLPAQLRWSARFADEILGLTAANNPLLLDHLLVSRHLLSGALPLVLNRQASLVEHEAYESHNAGANNSTRTSDHRPVSCRLDEVV